MRIDKSHLGLAVDISEIEIIDIEGASYLSFNLEYDEEDTTKTNEVIEREVGEFLIKALEQGLASDTWKAI